MMENDELWREFSSEQLELLDAAGELREAREHLERVRDDYKAGRCVLMFVYRAEDRLDRARRRAAKAELAVEQRR